MCQRTWQRWVADGVGAETPRLERGRWDEAHGGGGSRLVRPAEAERDWRDPARGCIDHVLRDGYGHSMEIVERCFRIEKSLWQM